MELLKKDLQIAIDGPVGSGKSLGAKLLSKKLGTFCLNTGATFRTVAFLASQEGLDFKDKRVVRILKNAKIEIFLEKKGGCQIILDGKEVTEKIFSRKMDWGASCVAAVPKIREILTRKWQKVAHGRPIVIEGRDISKVFPQADLKIYMTASLPVRAKRIQTDLAKSGIRRSYQEVFNKIKKRDYQDTHRKVNPLELSGNYWVLDTSRITPSQEVELVIEKLKEIKLVS